MRSPTLKASRYLTGCALLLASAGFADARTATGNRIAEALDSRSSLVLRDSAHPQAQARYEAGRVGGDNVLQGVSLYFSLSPAQQADLDELLRQQQDPLSPSYHQWLTPQQYASRFGLSAADRDRITAWLRGQGFTIDSVSASGNRVSFSGSVARIESVFQTELHRYQVDGESHFANATNLSVPAALSGMVLGVRGLDDFRPKPRFRAAPRFTSSISGNHFLTPGDFATIYNLKPLYSAGVTGSNRNIAVVGQAQINLGDIRAFRSAAGLSARDPVLKLVPGNTVPLKNGSDDMAESDIDIEWTGGVAPDATINFVYATNVFDALSYVIENNVAPVISVSYGLCESAAGSTVATFDSMFQQANAKGQTILTSSGDAGAADCDMAGQTTATQGLAVDFPASSPSVTGIGGTAFNEGSGDYWIPASSGDVISSARSYIPEVTWNDTGKTETDPATGATSTVGLSASGGGKSTHFTKPSWQTGTGVPGDNARFVPDLAVAASSFHDSYLYCTTDSGGHGTCVNGFRNNDAGTTLTAAGGTSFGAPAMAGVLTLVAQKSGAAGGLGNINPRLYQLAANTSDVFHDISSGNNKVPTSSGGSIGYNAGVGYDPATGLGSVDGNNLAAAWALSSSSSSSSGSGSSSSSSSSSSGGGSSSSSGSSSGGGGGGGGGAATPGVLALLASLLLLRRSRQGT